MISERVIESIAVFNDAADATFPYIDEISEMLLQIKEYLSKNNVETMPNSTRLKLEKLSMEADRYADRSYSFMRHLTSFYVQIPKGDQEASE